MPTHAPLNIIDESVFHLDQEPEPGASIARCGFRAGSMLSGLRRRRWR
jgi:hypothetical protein